MSNTENIMDYIHPCLFNQDTQNHSNCKQFKQSLLGPDPMDKKMLSTHIFKKPLLIEHRFTQTFDSSPFLPSCVRTEEWNSLSQAAFKSMLIGLSTGARFSTDPLHWVQSGWRHKVSPMHVLIQTHGAQISSHRCEMHSSDKQPWLNRGVTDYAPKP